MEGAGREGIGNRDRKRRCMSGGLGKEIVKLTVTLDGTGELIESGEKSAEHGGQGDRQWKEREGTGTGKRQI